MPCDSSIISSDNSNSNNNNEKEKSKKSDDSSSLGDFKLNESTFLASLMPKKEIGVDRFLHSNPNYDGRGALIAIFDSGVDPAVDGLQVTTDGKPKILDVIDCTGSGDIDTSKVVKADADGCISAASGASLVINTSWKNPSGEWHVGYKLVYELFTEDLTSRLKKERRKKWDEKNQEEIARAVKQLDDFDQKHIKVEDGKLKRVREDLQNRLDLLRRQSESYDDKGPVVDAVVWHDGDVWRAALDTQSLEDDPDCGMLANCVPLTNYRIERKYGVFSKLDACTFVVNVFNNGNVLSVVTDCSPHATHVAGIAAAFHPKEPLLNGVAPGAQLISCKIGDSRLGSMETGTGLIRALIAAVEHKCDLINMSYGEATLLPDYGRFVDLVNEVVNKHRLIFVSSAGNSGPGLSTVGAPGGTSSSIIGVGAYVSPAMAAGAHCVVEPPSEGLEYTWSSRGPTADGDLGVCISAPGGAVAPVPKWTLQRRMLMNGTSMASPSACGGTALLISAMKAEGIPVSPYSVRKALENTAVPIGDLPEDKLSTGQGLMQVDKAFEYIQKCQNFPCVQYQINIQQSGKTRPSSRGIYLREPSACRQTTEWVVQVNPKFHEDASNFEEKIPFEECIELYSTEKAVVKTPDYLLLTHNGRSFNLVVDPSNLCDGLHYYEVYGIDCKAPWRGPIFRIPITITKAKATTNQPLQVSFSNMLFQPGHIERRYIEVPHGASWFADIVSQMAQDLTLSGEFRSRLIKLARWLVESELVPVRLLQERCEEEFLGEAEFIKIKAQELKGKEVRVNTRLLYQQTKFNLLREESEGYAKLVTLLCRDSEAPTQKGSTSTIGIIKSLIGHFDLDPNRVFDIVLECFELQPDNDVFIELIPIFPKSHASQILGFKFQYYQRMEVSNPVPYGLYRLAALLVKQDFIDLDSIYAHLLPKDVEAFEHYSTFSSKRLDEANKIGKINLAATGKDLMDEEKTGDVTIDLFAALAMETDAVDERKSELQNNQTLGLLIGFLSVDDWYHAHVLFERLSALNPVEHIQICDSLFRLIEKSISSPYDVIRQAHLQNSGLSTGGSTDAMDVDNPSGHNSFIDLPKELFQMLGCTGPFLYRDTMLLQKVCRVLRGYYLSALELVSQGGALNPQFHVGNPNLHLKEARLRVEDALGACLLPSLQLVPANPAVGQEIWELMSLLPYEARYHLYGEWEKDDDRYPMLLATRQTAKLDTRRILKRLAKENLKQLGRMVAKLAHANPMTVLRTIVHQIEAYRDMITPVVDAFKYLTQLEYDILEYVVIERLALGGRDKLKDDGLNLSDWLQSLASFWGHLCKKYPSMELRGLFQYLVNQLKRGQGIELVLLQELIQQMANVQYTENLTEEQLDAMAGSETLKYQATSFGMTRNNKALIKSTSRLRDALLPKDEPKLATPLLLLLAQHRSLVLVNADAPYIKMVSEQFDRCHGTLLQYVDFLGSAVTPGSNYAILIPSLDDLIHLYHLDPEIAFLIYRPVMRLFKSQKTPDVCWPMEDKYSASDSSTNFEPDPTDYSGSMVLDIGSNKNPISWSDLLDTVKTMLPPKTWNSLSPDLYATFWGLTLYDLHVPKNRYESEIAKLHANLKSLEELSDNSSSAITKRKKEKERIQESLDRLSSELHKHEENVVSVSRRLFHEKDKWLSSCPDTLKINMEFLQRCIFPRCTFSMPDAVYCAMFVHKLHSLGTPFFNTVNHIDVLICKTLQPMICCCTEYEVGRLGRFLYETLKIAYHWKSDESIYERECGNMPGFAVYYRNPNGQRVTYGQFIKVHWKWSQRITRLLIQCLESSEYMEIRNALIMLTKISSVFPVTRKSGINLEKRVAKIKSDEREDLKVLATGVAAALAARKPSWVTDEEFGMGYLELKPAPSMTKSAAGNSAAVQSGIGLQFSQTESASGKHLDSGNTVKDQTVKTKTADGKSERTESLTATKSDSGHGKLKGSSMVNGVDAQSSLASPAGQSGALKSVENQKQVEESISRAPDEHITRNVESRPSVKQRSVGTGSLLKPSKQDPLKEDGRSGKTVTRTSGSSSSDKDLQTHASDGRHTGTNISSSVSANGNSVSGSAKGLAQAATTAFDGSGNESKAEVGAAKFSMVKDDVNEFADFTRGSSSRVVHSPRHENTATSKSSDKIQKRAGSADELDRLGKRRKGDIDLRDLEGEVRFSEREKLMDPRLADDKVGPDELGVYRTGDKTLERPKEKGTDRYEREHRERLDRLDKSRGDDFVVEKPRDRSIERYGRERSVERVQERGSERSFNRLPDKAKDDRNKLRYNDATIEKSHAEGRFHGQSLPPPPPLPPNMVPQSLGAGRRDEDADRRYGATRHSQRLSPRHEEKELRRSEETVILQDDPKRRKEDDFRDRKREEMKVEEREREKASILKEEDLNAASKRRKLKREHLPTMEPGEYSPVAPPLSGIGMSQAYDGRDRKGPMIQHASYIDEPSLRIHGKEVASKLNRRESDPLYDREWDDEKRQRADQKRRHRK